MLHYLHEETIQRLPIPLQLLQVREKCSEKVDVWSLPILLTVFDLEKNTIGGLRPDLLESVFLHR